MSLNGSGIGADNVWTQGARFIARDVNDEAGQADGSQAQPLAPAAGPSRRAVRARRSLALAGVIAIVALVPVVAGLLIGSGSAAAPKPTTPHGYTPVSGAPHRVAVRRTDGIPAGAGALVALVAHPTTMHSAPGGPQMAKLGTRTEFGSPEALWVVSHVPGWLAVVSPLAGNGHVGWIAQSATTLTRVDWELQVSLSARRLTVLSGDRVLARFTVAIGSAASPTPTGRFAVTDRLATGDPSGPYGCCILALSAHAPHAIPGGTGGNRIAIHSTSDGASIGEPDSHGCVRVTLAEGRWLMNHVPLGTPTVISS